MKPIEEQPVKPKRRRWFRFSLKSMLLLVALAAVPMSFIPKIQRARNQRQVVEMLDHLGNTVPVWVAYDYQIKDSLNGISEETRMPTGSAARQLPMVVPPAPVPKWSFGLLDKEYFYDVVEVHISRRWPLLGIDGLIVHIATLPKVRSVTLTTQNELTADDLAPLSQMHNLKKLTLGVVTDKSLEHISQLVRLESLDSLNSIRLPMNDRGAIQITDEGLPHIAKLPNLRSLKLRNGHFGLSSGENCTMVSDEGLVHLYGLKNLEFLRINSPQITQAGIDNLQMALPNCEILWNKKDLSDSE